MMQGWPPRWFTKPAKAELVRGDGKHAGEFINSLCKITKDSVAGKTGDMIVLRDWQQSLIDSLLARRKDGRRKFRQGLIGMPRKNAKSTLGSALALWFLLTEGNGLEVYSAAGDKEQARIVFGVAKRMVELEPELAAAITPYKDALEVPSRGSVYRCLSAEAYTKEGLNPNFVVFDEVHVQPNAELWDVMTLGSGARVDPLVLGITTAGSRTDSLGRDSHCYTMYQHGRRVASGEVDDPSFFFAWWEPKQGVDANHTDPKIWRESNPGFNDLVDQEDFESTVKRTSEAEFRTKRTNVWVTAAESALPYGAWDACLDAKREVAGDEDVVFFFDGSWVGDSTGIVGCTVSDKPHLFVVDCWENDHRDVNWRVPVPEVEERIRQACREWRVVEIACDPYRWQRTMSILDEENFPMVEFPNTVARMVPAWQSFYEAVLDARVTHDGDPRLARHVDNMVLKRDARGVRPTKESKSSQRHIDLGICAVGAHARATARSGQSGEILLAWA